jgi:hypothetical protein
MGMYPALSSNMASWEIPELKWEIFHCHRMVTGEYWMADLLFLPS